MHISTIFPIGRAKQIDELQLPAKEFKSVLDFIAAVRKKGEMTSNSGFKGFFGKYEGEVRYNLFFCRAGINVESILIDGSISTYPHRSNFLQGNINSDSIKDTWENKFQKHRYRRWAKQVNVQIVIFLIR